ncbi:MAG TPA: RsmD family RNA methyltransferase, partial [Thermoanaerobaculia bacterium]|nr:RsmD family RNA methyltransferase [Thermoanaerobaculia bacterium]
SFQVSVSSFFQGNRFLLDAFLGVIRAALGAAGPFRTALDLYAGVGFLTRPLLEGAGGTGGEVVAVEVDVSSSKDLFENLRRWTSEGLPGARADTVEAEAFLSSRRRSRDSGPFDVVVADPPRAGLSPGVRRALSRLRPESLLMVSCDPPTLARDVAAFHPHYAVRRLTLIDLFPGTHHVESVALLSRRT